MYLHTREYRDCFVATLTVLTADVISSHWHLCVINNYSHSWSWHGNKFAHYRCCDRHYKTK